MKETLFESIIVQYQTRITSSMQGKVRFLCGTCATKSTKKPYYSTLYEWILCFDD